MALSLKLTFKSIFKIKLCATGIYTLIYLNPG